MKCQFKLVFFNYQYCPYITSKLTVKKTMISRQKFSEKVISGFLKKGYTFNHIAEMIIITKANKLDVSYDFNIKHNMHVVKWKLKAMINKYKN